MTIVGLDDTDSRSQGMCTTYVAAHLAERLGREAAVQRCCLVRLNPAIPYKTRGNAALAVHTDVAPARAYDIARELVADHAIADDPATNPGLVVASIDAERPEATPAPLATFSERALREELTIETATELCRAHELRFEGWGDGRGVVGALAAVGAWRLWADIGEPPTHELIRYREPKRWGTERTVDHESVFAAAAAAYPLVWDTVDRVAGEPVCVPHTPGPVLYGIRGDELAACRRVAAAVESEPVAREAAFLTNQGTDAHLRAGQLGTTTDGRSYRLEGTVEVGPDTQAGGHVFLTIGDGTDQLPCVAFEPTKRFRAHVRALRVGDELTVAGERSEGTLKLEKFAVRSLQRTALVTPTCGGCGRRMESAGRDQGYRCRDCGTSAPGKTRAAIDRELEPGWYEVPPVARRHVAKPLVRGGFDAPTHPAR